MVGQRAGETLEAAVDAAMDGMAVVEPDGRISYANRGLASLLDADGPTDIEDTAWQRWVPPEAAERLETTVLSSLAAGERWHGRTWGQNASGDRIGLEAMLLGKPDGRSVWLLADVEGTPGGDHSIGHRTVLEHVRDAIYTLDDEGRITWVNEVAQRQFQLGYEVSDLVGEYVSVVLAPEDIDRSIEAISTLLTTDAASETFEITLQGAGGETIPAELHLSLLPLVDGEFRGSVGVVRDITERKRREQLLSVLNRVLRHNLRNEISVATGALDSLAADLEGSLGGDECERITRAEAALDRILKMGKTAREIQEVVEEPDRDPVRTDVASVLERAGDAATAADPDADVTVESPTMGPVRIDPLCSRAVSELAANAVTHNDRNSVGVWLQAGTLDDEPGTADELVIEVADDGPGIPPVERRVLTEMAETPLEHGSGLGLWLVKWVVSTAGGTLEIDERDPRGSVVRVFLPIQH